MRRNGFGRSAAVLTVLALAACNPARADGPKDDGPKPPPGVRTAAATRGDLAGWVRATGTVEPADVVDVAAQVVGVVAKFGPDPRGEADPAYKGKRVDFNTPVEEGSLLAQLDDTSYAAEVEQEQANCRRAEAEVEQAKVRLELADVVWRRARSRDKDSPTDKPAEKAGSPADAELAELGYKEARAAVAVAEAGVAQRRAGLRRAERNLAATRITSPVKGVIISRRVNVGQTVVPDLNTPALFLVASDLTKLQVWATVNEANIAAIAENQPARFTVEAYPGKVFEGRVAQVRLDATRVRDETNYTVVVAVAKSDHRLLPYLTADVEIVTDRRENVLRVPSAVLRWRPQSRRADPIRADMPARPKSRVWVWDGDSARPVDVKTGLTDGTMTEITGGELKEGVQVIVEGFLAEIDTRPPAGGG